MTPSRTPVPDGSPFGRLEDLERGLVACRRCPRLVEWREQVATEKRAAFADEEYWGRPVPGFGDPDAELVIVGLAPAAHGANRTGRMFTGDRSGDWLVSALHRTGFANQPTSDHADDGLRLINAWMTAPVRCAPPANRPRPDERDNCAGWLDAEMALLTKRRAILCLGQFGYQSVWRHLSRTAAGAGTLLPRPRPTFGHGVTIDLGSLVVSLSYHPSQLNTFTGKLTEEMFDDVLVSIRETLETGRRND